MKKIFMLIATALLLSSLVACSVPAASAMTVKSDKPRVSLTDLENTDLAELINGNTDFALNEIAELTADFICPFHSATSRPNKRSRQDVILTQPWHARLGVFLVQCT